MTTAGPVCGLDGELKAENFPSPTFLEHLHEQGALVWVDMCNPTIGSCELADELGFDQNAVEDVVRLQRADQATRYAPRTPSSPSTPPHLGPQVANDPSRAC